MSLHQDQQHLNDILEASQAAALEFLNSLPTRPAGRTPQPLSHHPLPEKGLGALQALASSARGTKPGFRPRPARATWAL